MMSVLAKATALRIVAPHKSEMAEATICDYVHG